MDTKVDQPSAPPLDLELLCPSCGHAAARHSWFGCMVNCETSKGCDCRHTLTRADPSSNLKAEVERLRASQQKLQDAYDGLTGEKFSDRVHVALRQRAEHAEAKLASLRIENHRLQDGIAKIAEVSRCRHPNDDKHERVGCVIDSILGLYEALGERAKEIEELRAAQTWQPAQDAWRLWAEYFSAGDITRARGLSEEQLREDLARQLKQADSHLRALEEIARGYVSKHELTPEQYARAYLDLVKEQAALPPAPEVPR